MKIIHISTGYNHGGAAIACRRLVEAQRDVGIDARIITQEKGYFPSYVSSITKNIINVKLNFFRLAWEKFIYLFFQSSHQFRFQYSIANSGVNLSTHKWISEADIIHLHWINGGFISIKGLEKLSQLKKPIVWTMHDIWPFTGGCHIAGDCINYRASCEGCRYLSKISANYLSKRQYKQKGKLYDLLNINFISPGENHKKRALSSSLLKNKKIQVIPNIIETKEFNYSKKECRDLLEISHDKIIICFGAYNVNTEHKGMEYLIEALGCLKHKKDIELLYFGKATRIFDTLEFKVHYGGFIFDEERLNIIYAASDIFVSPSTEESFGLTVGEAMAVGTPAVSFTGTGVKDVIDHKINGYLAVNKNSTDLALGIEWCFENNAGGKLSEMAAQKIALNFNPQLIAKKIKKYYLGILNE